MRGHKSGHRRHLHTQPDSRLGPVCTLMIPMVQPIPLAALPCRRMYHRMLAAGRIIDLRKCDAACGDCHQEGKLKKTESRFHGLAFLDKGSRTGADS